MNNSNAKGSCLCGEVTYQISGNTGLFQYCHCSQCQKVTGSAHASNLFVLPTQFKWLNGEENVGRFQPENKKYFATAFCKTCGSSLPWLVQAGNVVVVPAGSLDSDPGISPIQNIFCSSKADWYTAPNSLPEYDELPTKK